MKTKWFIAMAIVLSTVGTLVTPVQARQGTKTVAMTFRKAGETWAQVIADRKSLDESIRQGKLDDAHDLVFSIRDGVVTLPYKSEALPAAKKAALAKLVTEVAKTATALDGYADNADAANTRLQYARLQKTLTAIAALYPANALPTSGARPMSAAERALFLTPGGLYTAADIAANGNTSIYQKFPGYVPSHETKLNSGDPVCPISETKPDPKLVWVVGGKTYRFCCPPCVAEFVKKAKTDPASIKPPAAYVKP